MEDAVVVNIALSDDGFGTPEDDVLVEVLDARIRAALQSAAVGKWDGHEFGGGWARVFCCGPSADALFEVLANILLAVERLPAGSYAVKRYHSQGTPQQIIQLSSGAA